MNHLAYVDTSAFIKLLLTEPETAALRTALSDWPDLVSSEILGIEAHRVGIREGRQAGVATLLQAVTLLAYTPAIGRRAKRRSALGNCERSTRSTSPPPKRSATTSA